MVAEKDVTIEAGTQYDPSGMDELKRDVDSAKEKVRDATYDMGTNFLSTARDVSYLATAFIGLESTVDRAMRGQIGLGEASLRLIPTFVSLTAAIWSIVGAEEARAVASAIAQAITTGGLSLPLTAAASAAGAALALAAIARIPKIEPTGYSAVPKMHEGGYVTETREYLLKAGETVLPPGQRSTTNVFHIHIGAGVDGRRAARDFVTEMRSRGIF